jgi:hypothetical protein
MKSKAIIFSLILATVPSGMSRAQVVVSGSHATNGEQVTETANGAPGYKINASSELDITGSGSSVSTTGSSSHGIYAAGTDIIKRRVQVTLR